MKPINKVLEIKAIIKDPLRDFPQLNAKEKMVGKLAIMGYQNPVIAEMLNMPIGTVKVYMQNICKATGLKKQRLSGWVIEKIYAVLDEPSK